MKRLAICVCSLLVSAGALFAQSDLQSIANIKLQKTEPITLKQLKTRVDAYQKEMNRVMSVEDRKKVLDTIINERLVVQAAERDGVKIPDSEVNQNFTQMISQQIGKNVTELEFAQMVKEKSGMSLDDYMKSQNGMTVAEYKGFLKNQLIAQRYVMMKKQADLQSIPGPSDADIRSSYELNKQSFVQPDMVKLFLVVVPKGDNSQQAETKLKEFHKQLKDKSASANEIKVRSQTANSGYQAGDLYVNKNPSAAKQLGIPMEALLKIFEMQTGEVSDVTETAVDWQCFVVQEKYAAKILDLSDIVKPGTTVTVYEYIRGNMMSQAQGNAIAVALQQIINDLRKPENFQILKSGADLDKLLSW